MEENAQFDSALLRWWRSLFPWIDVEEVAVRVADENFAGFVGEVGFDFAPVCEKVVGGFFDIGDSKAESGNLDFVLAEIEADRAVF